MEQYPLGQVPRTDRPQLWQHVAPRQIQRGGILDHQHGGLRQALQGRVTRETVVQGTWTHPLVGKEAIDPLGLSPAARRLRDGIAGRSANASKMQAKRARSRLSGKTVSAATRAAQSVCMCIARPPLGLKACCRLLLSYYPLSAPWSSPAAHRSCG